MNMRNEPLPKYYPTQWILFEDDGTTDSTPTLTAARIQGADLQKDGWYYSLDIPAKHYDPDFDIAIQEKSVLAVLKNDSWQWV